MKNYCIDVLQKCKEKLKATVAIHLTSKTSVDEEMQEMGGGGGGDAMIPGRPDWDKVFDAVHQESWIGSFTRVAVLVCGPSTMTHHVWDTCNSKSDDKVLFELHRETFKL